MISLEHNFAHFCLFDLSAGTLCPSAEHTLICKEQFLMQASMYFYAKPWIESQCTEADLYAQRKGLANEQPPFDL